MADLSIHLGCFGLSGPLLLEKQNLAPGNRNVWGCQGLGMSRMGFNLLWVKLGLRERLLHPGWSKMGEQRDQDKENMDHFSRGKSSSGWGQSLKATTLKSCNLE